MENIIKPRDFLIQLKSKGTTSVVILPSDLLEIAELSITIPVARALIISEFYNTLKKAVSDFNADSALSGNTPIDFDDLYTKYCEYVEALKGFMPRSD